MQVTVAFNLMSTQEFSTHCYCGNGMPMQEDQTKQILTTLQLVHGGKFDWSSSPPKFVFPITYHDQLYAILEERHNPWLTVEPLPVNILKVSREKVAQESSASLIGNGQSQMKLDDIIPGHLLDQLAPFQKQGVEFILKNEGRALLADDMGLGKTRTAIACAVAYSNEWPVLVVCPSSARHNWHSEIVSLLTPTIIKKADVLIVESASNSLHPETKNGRGRDYKFVIVSYNLIQKMETRLRDMSFGMIICDECHYLKNGKANRTKVLTPMIKESKRAIMISGTPALSRPMELFTQLNALNAKSWPDEKEFGRRYCRTEAVSTLSPNGVAQSEASNSEFKGASNTQELHVLLTSTLMIRRLKKDILSSLPEKVREVVKVDVKDDAKKAALRKQLDMFLLHEAGKATGLNKKVRKTTSEDSLTTTGSTPSETPEDRKAHMSLLLQLFTHSGEAKLPGVLEHVKIFLDNPRNGKLLIFAHHRVVMDSLAEYIVGRGVDMVRIDGQSSGRERHTNTTYFQATPTCRVALLAITAAGKFRGVIEVITQY